MPILSINEQDLALQHMVLRKNSIYFYRKTSDYHYEVFRYNINDGSVAGTGVTQPLKGQRFNVSLDENFIYLDDGIKGDIDIGLIQLSVDKR